MVKQQSLKTQTLFMSKPLIFYRLSPVGVFFLVTAKLLEIGSFSEVVGQLGWYFVTVMLGLFLHGFGKATSPICLYLNLMKLSYRHNHCSVFPCDTKTTVRIYRTNGPSIGNRVRNGIEVRFYFVYKVTSIF